MKLNNLTNISTLDGRYAQKVDELRAILSEYGLIRYRLLIEIHWLDFLANCKEIPDVAPLNAERSKELRKIYDNFSIKDAERIKQLESETNHDVKAVEYFLREQILKNPDLHFLSEFIHFACTSEDINNLSYALMIKNSYDEVIQPAMTLIENILTELSHEHAHLPMISRTHGQVASPTTLGKELANFLYRLKKIHHQTNSIQILGKFNGAVGNYNAHLTAYPGVDWQSISKEFVESLGLQNNPLTTQIEPHDWMSEHCQALIRYNTVLIDLSKDIWTYISLGYFKQRTNKNEVGSSTMPHKVNPIDFENAEGNCGLAIALFNHFSLKLPISRLQRDLSDSTTQRNFGCSFGYMLIALKALEKGLKKLEVDKDTITQDIDDRWEVLAEPIQTVMRLHGISNAYEKLKEFTRGEQITRQNIHEFINTLELPDVEKNRLLEMTPNKYIGLAKKLATNKKYT